MSEIFSVLTFGDLLWIVTSLLFVSLVSWYFGVYKGIESTKEDIKSMYSWLMVYNCDLHKMEILREKKMVELTTASGEKYEMTQEKFLEKNGFVKLGDTVINKAAIERIDYYTVGEGIIRSPESKYHKKDSVVVKYISNAEGKIQEAYTDIVIPRKEMGDNEMLSYYEGSWMWTSMFHEHEIMRKINQGLRSE